MTNNADEQTGPPVDPVERPDVPDSPRPTEPEGAPDPPDRPQPYPVTDAPLEPDTEPIREPEPIPSFPEPIPGAPPDVVV